MTRNPKGFTLIEVVVTIVVSSILAVLLMQIMRGHAWRSYWPLTQMNHGLALHEVMEDISADYRNLLISNARPLETLQNRINSNPPYYWAVKSFGASIGVRENRCLDDIQKDGASPGGEVRQSGSGQCIHPTDTILKITLSYGHLTLTALFTR